MPHVSPLMLKTASAVWRNKKWLGNKNRGFIYIFHRAPPSLPLVFLFLLFWNCSSSFFFYHLPYLPLELYNWRCAPSSLGALKFKIRNNKIVHKQTHPPVLCAWCHPGISYRLSCPECVLWFYQSGQPTSRALHIQLTPSVGESRNEAGKNKIFRTLISFDSLEMHHTHGCEWRVLDKDVSMLQVMLPISSQQKMCLRLMGTSQCCTVCGPSHVEAPSLLVQRSGVVYLERKWPTLGCCWCCDRCSHT